MVNFQEIEKKWQKRWEEAGIFKVKGDTKKKKFYCLEMFPYPSGSGLHMGHVRNYAMGDCTARFKRMHGFNVLYPMGYDAFGLPAENAAIKNKTHPKTYTETSMSNIEKNQRALGLSYDWSRKIATCYPEYYKWNQWFFLQFLKKGLAYKKEAPVNWCPKCTSVLANEQVEDGKCWRCESHVEEKRLEQWFFKITDYADRLLKDITKLEWPEKIKKMQENWIGRSEGTEIFFKMEGSEEFIPAFTTRPDTIFSVTFIVLAPEHPLVMRLVKGTKYEKGALDFIEKTKKESLIDRTNEAKEKEGFFMGRYVINPASKEKIPVWAANFAIMDYGTGAVMCDAHDKRDFRFARKYGIPLKFVITPSGQNCIIVHGSNSSEKNAKEGKPENLRHWKPWLKENLEKLGIKTSNELYPEDWLPDYDKWKIVFEKTTINENTTLVGHSAGTAFLLRWLAENKRKINKLILVAPYVIKTEKYKYLNRLNDFTYDSSLKKYFNKLVILYSDNDGEHIIKSAKEVHSKLGGDLICIKGMGHFCYEDMHTEKFPQLLEAILESHEAFTDDGILFNSGQFDGLPNRKALPEISDWLVKSKNGKRVLNYKIRDWLISRQRYWGTPIPVVYCDKCGMVPVPEKDLPVLLPEKTTFTGQGNPLANTLEFVDTKCPQCGGKAKRETDTMDTFVDSSWYFLRFCNPQINDFAFDKNAVKHWMTVDQYIGGAEHAVMHLLYARFFCKVLKDMGLVDFDEPFAKLFNQGILYKDGHKMSKSFGNVVTQEEMSQKYGIDTARLFLLFVGSPEKEMEWSDRGVDGVFRFVNRVYRIMELDKGESGIKDRNMESRMHRAIKQVTGHVDGFEFHKAIGEIMSYVNYLCRNSRQTSEPVFKRAVEVMCLLLSPFAPHLAEEVWESIGNKGFVSLERWPKFDPKKIDEKADYLEDLVENVSADIKEVLTLLKMGKPKKVSVYVAEEWKYRLFGHVKKQLGKTHNMGEILKEVMKDTGMKKHGNDVAQAVGAIVKDPSKIPPIILDAEAEAAALQASKSILESGFGCVVDIILAEKSGSPKAKKASPGKPGIEIV